MPVQKSKDVPVWEKPDPTKSEDHLSKKKKASAKARAMAAGRPYPNLIDNMAVSKEEPTSLKISGKLHRIYEDKNGDIVVNHAGSKKQNGKYDKINLSDMAGVKSVKGGVKATTNWHKEHPHINVEKFDTPAWTRSEGKNPEGGLNAKGRASAKAEGHNLKPPVKSGNNPRRASFLARMGGMPGPEHKPNGEPTRLLLSLQKWGASSKEDAKRKAAAISVNKGLPSALRNPKFHPETWHNRSDYISTLRRANTKGKEASQTWKNPYRVQATMGRLKTGKWSKIKIQDANEQGIAGVRAMQDKDFGRVINGEAKHYKYQAPPIKAGTPSTFKESGVGKSMVSPGVYKPARLLSAAERKSVKSGKHYAASQGAAAQARDIENKALRNHVSGPGRPFGVKKPSLIRRADIESGGYTKIKRNVYVKSSGKFQDVAIKHAEMLPKMRRPTIVMPTDKLPMNAGAAAGNFGSKSSPRYILIPESGVSPSLGPKRTMMHESAHANTKRNFAGNVRLKLDSKGNPISNSKKTMKEEARADRYAAKNGGAPKNSYRFLAGSYPIQSRNYISHTYKLWSKDNPMADKAIKIGTSSGLVGTSAYGIKNQIKKSYEVVSKVFPQRAILTQGTRKVRVMVHYEYSPTHWGIIHPTEGQRVAHKDSIRFIPNKKPKSPGPDLFGEPLQKSLISPGVWKPAVKLTKTERAALRADIKAPHISDNSYFDNIKRGMDSNPEGIAWRKNIANARKPDLDADPGLVKLKRNVYMLKMSENPSFQQRVAQQQMLEKLKGLPKMRRPTVLIPGTTPGTLASASNFGPKSAPRIIFLPDDARMLPLLNDTVLRHEAAHANTKANYFGYIKQAHDKKGRRITRKSALKSQSKKAQFEEARADYQAKKYTGKRTPNSYALAATQNPIRSRHYISHTYRLWGKDNPNKAKAINYGTPALTVGGVAGGVKFKDCQHPRDNNGKFVKKSMEYSVVMNQSRFGGSGAVGRNLEDVEKGVRLDKFAETKAGKRYLKYDSHSLPKRPKRDAKGTPYLEAKYKATKEAKRDAAIAAVAGGGAAGAGVAVRKEESWKNISHYQDKGAQGRSTRRNGKTVAGLGAAGVTTAYGLNISQGDAPFSVAMDHYNRTARGGKLKAIGRIARVNPVAALAGGSVALTGVGAGMYAAGSAKNRHSQAKIAELRRKRGSVKKAEPMYDAQGNPVPDRKPLMSGNAKLGAAGTAIGLAGGQRMISAATLPNRLQGQSDAIASKVKFNERLANDQIQRVQNASQIRNPLTRRKQVRMHQYYSDKAQSTLADSRAKQITADNALKAAPAKKLAHLKSGAGLVATGGVMGGLAVYNNAKDRKNKAQVK